MVVKVGVDFSVLCCCCCTFPPSFAGFWAFAHHSLRNHRRRQKGREKETTVKKPNNFFAVVALCPGLLHMSQRHATPLHSQAFAPLHNSKETTAHGTDPDVLPEKLGALRHSPDELADVGPVSDFELHTTRVPPSTRYPLTENTNPTGYAEPHSHAAARTHARVLKKIHTCRTPSNSRSARSHSATNFSWPFVV